jgi:hypothetical protein
MSLNAWAIMRIHKHDANVFTAAQEFPKSGSD